MDSSRQQEELAVAVYNKDPQKRWHDFTVYKLLLRGKFTCVIACVCQWYTAHSMVYIQCVYRSIPGKRPWALNPSKLNRGGVGAYPG